MQATAQMAAAMLNIDAGSNIPDDGPWIPKENAAQGCDTKSTTKHP
jgi:hypothetical protein